MRVQMTSSTSDISKRSIAVKLKSTEIRDFDSSLDSTLEQFFNESMGGEKVMSKIKLSLYLSYLFHYHCQKSRKLKSQ